jgi:hypothetical protein
VGGALAALVLVELPRRMRLPEAAATVLCAALGAIAVAGSIMVAS